MSNERIDVDNPIREKSFAFAIRIVRLYRHLTGEKKEFIISKQLLMSGTSMGANVKEGIGGISKKDFRAELSLASCNGLHFRRCF